MNIQISDVFKTFATSDSESSVVYSRSRLALKPNTHLIIGTPTSVVQYSAQKILRGVQVVCVDEADVLLTGGESKATWEILETMRTFYKQDLDLCMQTPDTPLTMGVFPHWSVELALTKLKVKHHQRSCELV